MTTLHPEAYLAIRAAQNALKWGEHATYRYLDRHTEENRLEAVLRLFELAQRLRKETEKDAVSAELEADMRLTARRRYGSPWPASVMRWMAGEPILPAVIQIEQELPPSVLKALEALA